MTRTASKKFRTMFVLPDISDDAPASVKEGTARRRLVASSPRRHDGPVSVRAVLELPDVIVPGTVTVVTIRHEAGCPATEVEV